jgi:hypothetical protein
MTTWTREELDKIGRADELEIASVRGDGTLGKRVTIWVVPYEDDLYVRSWKGKTAAWFRATQRRRRGRVWAGGLERDVTFVNADHDLDDAIDAVYRDKYRRYSASFVDPMVSPEARATTIKLVPQERGTDVTAGETG